MNAPIPLEEAWDALLALLSPLGVETVESVEAVGRILGEDLVARRTQPARDLSAMDGFACHGDGPWTIAGESRAGTPFARPIEAGQAVRISTGAALPDGADRILIIEEARIDGSRLTAGEAPEPGRHIRRKGLDFAEGVALIARGTRIDAAKLALARAAGHGALPVHLKPRVAVIECGDELVADPAQCPPDRLPASNGAMLSAMVEAAGGEPFTIGPVADEKPAMREAFAEAGDADLIVTSGGASVGEHDLVRPVLEELGAELAFWKVAIRPGKPLMVAKWRETIVLGLPGNPVSSFVTGFLFALPAIRALSGAADALPKAIMLPLAADVAEGGSRREFLRARITGNGVRPIAERDSSALRALAAADLLIDRPIGVPEAKAGTPVPCYLL